MASQFDRPRQLSFGATSRSLSIRIRQATADLINLAATMSALKLPKEVLADPRHEAVEHLLTTHAGLLWEGGRHPVATLPMTAALSQELRRALSAGHACQGLELIAERLSSEQKGLDALNAKTPGSPQNARISRILFLANDGSTRFYRDSEALLSRYPQRLLVCRLDIEGESLGQALLGSPKMVRSVLVFDKKVGAKALLALLPPA